MQTDITVDNHPYTVNIHFNGELFYVELPERLSKQYQLPGAFVIQRLLNVFESNIASYGIHGLSIFEQVSTFLKNEPGMT